MPEGPEIRFEFDRIKKIKGHVLEHIKILSGRYIRHPLGKEYKELVDRLPLKITKMGVKGKTIWWELENGMGIVVTHGMSGGWKIDGDIKREYSGRWFQDKHDRIQFTIDNAILYFNDMRNFGTIHITTNKEQLQKKLDSLGPSVLDHPTEKGFWERFSAKKYQKKPIGILLMEQELVAGIGNYLRADILWKARISPYRLYEDLSEEDKKNIYQSAIQHCQYHYNFMKKHGEIFPEGREATFLVYGKEKDPLGNPVTSEKMGPRTIHWVPSIQK